MASWTITLVNWRCITNGAHIHHVQAQQPFLLQAFWITYEAVWGGTVVFFSGVHMKIEYHDVRRAVEK